MSRRELALWGTAFLLSLLAHAALFWEAGARVGADRPATTGQRTITRVSFRSEAAPPPDRPPQTVRPERLPEPSQARPEPPKPRPTSKPRPAHKAEKPKAREQADPKPPQSEPPPVPQAAAARASDPAPAQAGQAIDDPALIEQARREYLSKLIAQIEAHKIYPRAARRRGIEGEVVVSFKLESGARMVGLQAIGGHSLLRDAADETVRSSLPFPPPPSELALPMDVSFTMVFALR